MPIDTGGPAYPNPGMYFLDTGAKEPTEVHQNVPGCSLLDFFAAHALTGLLAAEAAPETQVRSFEETASDAYKQSQAMLSERKRLTKAIDS